MPLYEYKCKCGHAFADVYKINDRLKPTEDPCKECGETTVERVLSAPRIVSGVGDLRAKVSDNFKDRLREIKKTAGPTSTIDV